MEQLFHTRFKRAPTGQSSTIAVVWRGPVRFASVAGCVAASALMLGGVPPTARSDTTEAPVVTRIRPDSGPATGGTRVTIRGSGFVDVTAVSFGSAKADPATFELISPTVMRAYSPPNPVGTLDVTVTTAAGTSTQTVADLFTYDAPPAHDTVPPTEPRSLKARFSFGSLLLSWHRATDNVGVRRYVLYRNGVAFRWISGKATHAALDDFRALDRTVFTLRAFDAAGNGSAASNNVVVRPRLRPLDAPLPTPLWALRLFGWQTDGGRGARPAAPMPLPAWYGPWKAWRLAPYAIRPETA